MRLKAIDISVIITITISGLIVFNLLLQNNDSVFIYAYICTLFVVLIFIILSIYRQAQITFQAILNDQNKNYQQIEALFSIFSLIKPNLPLPPMRNWALSPDMINYLITYIYEYKPQVIVELGGGISTLISGYCLQNLGSGQIFSFDHNREFANITRNNIKKHDIKAQIHIIDAPLIPIEIGGNSFDWYQKEKFQEISNIDMLIIDGPPYVENNLSRYPTLPLLYSLLNPNAIIIIDDGNRDDINKIVHRWLNEFDDLTLLSLPIEKGGFVLHKSSKTNTL